MNSTKVTSRPRNGPRLFMIDCSYFLKELVEFGGAFVGEDKGLRGEAMAQGIHGGGLDSLWRLGAGCLGSVLSSDGTFLLRWHFCILVSRLALGDGCCFESPGKLLRRLIRKFEDL